MSTGLGIDPSLTSTGWAVLRDGRLVAAGVIRTKPERGPRQLQCEDDARRALYIHDALREVVNTYDPALVGLEGPAGSKSARTAKALGLSWAAVLCAVGGWPRMVVTAAEVKRHVADSRSASKATVEAQVRAALGGATWDRLLDGVTASKHEHAYDAGAVALTVAHKARGVMEVTR